MINYLMLIIDTISDYLWPPGAIGTKCEHCLFVCFYIVDIVDIIC